MSLQATKTLLGNVFRPEKNQALHSTHGQYIFMTKGQCQRNPAARSPGSMFAQALWRLISRGNIMQLVYCMYSLVRKTTTN
jgi:hypothetical protein